MKKLSLLLLLFIVCKVKGQDTLIKEEGIILDKSLIPQLNKEVDRIMEEHKISDSICLSIEKNKESYLSVIDTIKVMDVNNPLKVVDWVFWKYYYTTSLELKLVLTLENHQKIKTAYYFKDTLLIKVLKNDLSKKTTKTFYYDELDNSKPETEIKELAKTSDDQEFYQLLGDAKVDLRYFKKNPQRFKKGTTTSLDSY